MRLELNARQQQALANRLHLIVTAYPQSREAAGTDIAKLVGVEARIDDAIDNNKIRNIPAEKG